MTPLESFWLLERQSSSYVRVYLLAGWCVLQALADADRRALSAGVELSGLQRQLAEARGERDASQVR
jgi:hypothetical protein